jgi:DNA (cytosine-5)-methyltransferase 1
MRIGSFCSGYGGLDLAVAAHFNATVAWHSELDKDCARVLAARFPGVSNLGDLTVIDWAEVEPVDIICAGFPCQPFSHAGKRQGADDERAIFEYIADGLSVLRPGLVVLENVPGILTLGGASVIGTLTGLGYDCRWGIVRASDTGAPHRRARWFCVASDTDGVARPTTVANDRRRGEVARPGEVERTLRSDGGAAADADDGRCEGVRPERGLATATIEPRTTYRFGAYEPAIERWERILGRPAPDPTDDRGLRAEFVEWMMGLPEGWVCDLGLSRTGALKMLGNGVVPQQAALALGLLSDA